MTGYRFDAAATLKIGTRSPDPLPTPEPGVILLRIPDGLTLQALRDSLVGKQYMYQQDWYDKYAWGRIAPPAGIYRLRIPVPDSIQRTTEEQVAMLPTGETLAPVVLVVAAFLCIRWLGGFDLLQDGNWTRCAEQTANGNHVVLAWFGSRLVVYGYWGDCRYNRLYASSVRTQP